MAASFPLIWFIILTEDYLISYLIAKILVMSGLDPRKAHGQDMISICMLKICGESIHKPSESIF